VEKIKENARSAAVRHGYWVTLISRKLVPIGMFCVALSRAETFILWN
jgi:hypothetical protein